MVDRPAPGVPVELMGISRQTALALRGNGLRDSTQVEEFAAGRELEELRGIGRTRAAEIREALKALAERPNTASPAWREEIADRLRSGGRVDVIRREYGIAQSVLNEIMDDFGLSRAPSNPGPAKQTTLLRAVRRTAPPGEYARSPSTLAELEAIENPLDRLRAAARTLRRNKPESPDRRPIRERRSYGVRALVESHGYLPEDLAVLLKVQVGSIELELNRTPGEPEDRGGGAEDDEEALLSTMMSAHRELRASDNAYATATAVRQDIIVAMLLSGSWKLTEIQDAAGIDRDTFRRIRALAASR